MAPKSLKPPVQQTAASGGEYTPQHFTQETPETPPVQDTIHHIPHSGLNAPSAASATTTTTTTSNTHSLLIRPLQSSDEAALLRIWLEGWEDTLVQFAPVVWCKLASIARLAAAALAAAVLCCAAVFATRLPRPAAPLPPPPAPVGLSSDGVLPAPQLLPARLAALLSHWLGFGSESVWAAQALVLPALVASLPGWVLAAAAVAALLAAGPALVPPRVQLALLRVFAHRLIRRTCPDMWSMSCSWDRAAGGREYWVAELQPGRRVVGGVALKAGAGVRPLVPLVAAAVLNVAAVLPGEPAEDEAGFNKSDVQGHGPLEGCDALVYRMVTDKTVRRCGVGRRLMEGVMERAEAVGVRRVLLATANAEAIKFYRACGFETRPGAVAGHGGNVLWRNVAAVPEDAGTPLGAEAGKASERTSDLDNSSVKVDSPAMAFGPAAGGCSSGALSALGADNE